MSIDAGSSKARQDGQLIELVHEWFRFVHQADVGLGLGEGSAARAGVLAIIGRISRMSACGAKRSVTLAVPALNCRLNGSAVRYAGQNNLRFGDLGESRAKLWIAFPLSFR
jgi:hypothetical protein